MPLPQIRSARYDPFVTNATDRVLKLVVAYDGTRFKGWQRGNGRTVQAVLEEALSCSLGTASGGAVRERLQIEVVGAGRTDAGVHAEGQVASFRAPSAVDPIRLWAAVNRQLPDDLAVLAISPADDRFHARYRAVAKTYRYRVVDGISGSPLLHRFSWRVRETLDQDRLEAAAAVLIGSHDFSAFTADKGKKDKVRRLESIDFERPALLGANPLDMLFRGDGFLWNQVRIMAAALVAAGTGSLTAADIARLLASRDRSAAPPPAPACGLTLVSVEYPDART